MRFHPPAPARAVSAALALVLSLTLASVGLADLGGETSPWKAIVGARLVTGPGVEPFPGTLLLREGQIEAVGASVELPPGTLVFERPGRVIYPGLIEPYLEISPEEEAPATSDENPKVRPERRVVDSLPLDEDLAEGLRNAGFTTAHVVADAGILRGQTAVVSLAGGIREDVLASTHAQTLAFERTTWTERAYPNSLMGAIALTRQTLLDAAWSREAQDAWRRGSRGRPEANASWEGLRSVLAGGQRLWIESEDLTMLPRAIRVADEFELSPVIVTGNSDEYQRIAKLPGWLESVGASLVLSVDFPEAPSWKDDDDRMRIELDTLLHWERAPHNPARLAAANIPFAVTSTGLDSAADVRGQLRLAIRHGLSEEAALAAMTTQPARLLGLERRLGTLETGKDANFVLCDDELFASGSSIEEVWIDGERHGESARRLEKDDVTKKWDLRIGEGESAQTVRISISSGDDGLEGKLVPEGEPEPETDGNEGDAGSDSDGAVEDDAIELRDVTLERGVLRFVLPREAGVDGEYRLELERDAGFLRGRANISRAWMSAFARVVKKSTEEEPIERVGDDAPAWPPTYPTSGAGSVIVRNATVWTCGPDGTQEETDLLVVDGRIRSVGTDLKAPSQATEVDGTGLHVTPGLIDCHSHSSITGGVNECTNSCTAEVRIGDVVNPTSSAIYRELAGGLTISNLLHGSCNVIGGQNAVIKLKYGAPAADMFFGAPQGIKFALGENVKQSNWTLTSAERTRYPQTRMGVEQFLRERFHAAEDYRAEWNRWRKDEKGMPPRRDLQLDALVEILDGDRLVHCHSYRADEIIMLIRVAEDFGFRVGTFQHVLEGYKCANELAAHGAGASAFSDWWSYKYEVVDAIPYAGQIMWNRGVVTSFNSDSSELSRRMNLEAAKAVKYGRVPEEEALKFVTLNPAIQLGIEDRVGSLEKGKDGDFVLWSGHPLSDFSIPLGTWIEGHSVFSRDDDLSRRDAALELRARLLAKAEDAGGDGKKKGKKRRRGANESAFGERWQDSEVAHREMGDCIDTCCGEVE